MKYLTKTIWILSFISLYTDMASEMLYPIMPLYLKSIGFSILGIGILEGVAECIAGLSKTYFGRWSDLINRRAPFIQFGYTLSAISKPLMAIMPNVLFVFTSRTIDRIGKGIRSGARDAMLSDESNAENKASVFGFHRSMDTIGAVLGPSLALIYLNYNPVDYQSLFFLAFIPGILAICLSLFLKDKTIRHKQEKLKPGLIESFSYWRDSNRTYKNLIAPLVLFALVNSSDVFLLLKMKDCGIEDHSLILIYIFYNIVYVILAYPLGILADKIGLRKIFLSGLMLFSIVYFGFSIIHDWQGFILLFFLYGIYAASTEGIVKAWISLIAPKTEIATAIGFYSSMQSVAALLASILAGFLWTAFGSSACFIFSGLICFFVIILIVFKTKEITIVDE